MSDDDRETSIRVTNVSKKYSIFNTPGDRLKEALNPVRRKYHTDFWALSNINLEIKEGQTVGLVGRNGSGKSTLLQVLAGILQPTEGNVEVNGEIAALLELGTGFNPELTGRENVVLYNAIMKRPDTDTEARSAFIEEFADIGGFYDYPVKTYSSGMFARLAFAAAIATDPDILIIDEILAVGDARFLQKSYRYLRSIQERGATLFIVSHNAETILTLCDTVIYMDAGKVNFAGDPRTAISRYHGDSYRDQEPDVIETIDTPVIDVASGQRLADIVKELPDSVNPILADGSALYTGMPCHNKNEEIIANPGAQIEDFIVLADGIPNFTTLTGTEEIEIFFKVRFDANFHFPHIGFGIVTVEGLRLAGSNTHMRGERLPAVRLGDIAIYRVSVKLNFNSGDYFINFGFLNDKNGVLSMVCIRRLAIHLSVSRQNACSGFLALPCELELFTSTQRVGP